MEWAITSRTRVLKHTRIACYCHLILTTDINMMMMKGTHKKPTQNLEKASNTKTGSQSYSLVLSLQLTSILPMIVVNDTQNNIFWFDFFNMVTSEIHKLQFFLIDGEFLLDPRRLFLAYDGYFFMKIVSRARERKIVSRSGKNADCKSQGMKTYS